MLVDEEGICGHGALVMEYLEGRPLDYDLDLKKAAACLADVHSVPVPADSHLLSGGNTAAEILAECRQMFQVYRQSPLSEPYKTAWIDELLDKGEAGAKSPLMTDYTPCCINTELNNTNFLVDDESGLARLIDWEKPLYGDPAQDLGHFLAPTTTFWKTDVILSRGQMDRFIDDYIEAAHGPVDGERLRDRVNILAPVTVCGASPGAPWRGLSTSSRTDSCATRLPLKSWEDIWKTASCKWWKSSLPRWTRDVTEFRCVNS